MAPEFELLSVGVPSLFGFCEALLSEISLTLLNATI